MRLSNESGLNSMKSRMFTVSLSKSLALMLAVSAMSFKIQAANSPLSQQQIADVVSASDRPQEDRQRDESRKPAQVLTFTGIGKGLRRCRRETKRFVQCGSLGPRVAGSASSLSVSVQPPLAPYGGGEGASGLFLSAEYDMPASFCTGGLSSPAC